jgi:hypothetical protein
MKTALALLALTLANAGAADFQTFQAADVVLGQPDFTSGSSISGRPNRFDQAFSAALDPTTGKVFVADLGNNRVLRFSSAAAAQNGSNPELVFGQPNFSLHASNQGGAASAATFDTPIEVLVDSQGSLWVSDKRNNRVLCFYLASTILANDPPADFVLGQPDFTTTASGTTASQMKSPYGLSLGPDGTLWVADLGNNRVLRFASVNSKSAAPMPTACSASPTSSRESWAPATPRSTRFPAPPACMRMPPADSGWRISTITACCASTTPPQWPPPSAATRPPCSAREALRRTQPPLPPAPATAGPLAFTSTPLEPSG